MIAKGWIAARITLVGRIERQQAVPVGFGDLVDAGQDAHAWR